MKIIYTVCGKEIKVDDDDYGSLSKCKWYLSCGYAIRNLTKKIDGICKHSTIKMHRQLLSVEPWQEIDHVNLDKLDNRKSNLRICNKSENCRNKQNRKDNKTGYKGVSYRKNSRNYWARIMVNGKAINLGRHKSAEIAYEAYCKAAEIYHKEYKRLS